MLVKFAIRSMFLMRIAAEDVVILSLSSTMFSASEATSGFVRLCFTYITPNLIEEGIRCLDEVIQHLNDSSTAPLKKA